ncbi:MAG: Sugar phosphate isomerase/epimerase [Pedosphaera sp.]|nr:Sugar phosphate isomerase/epimerase [Pedosphaera sp.]
MKNTNPLNRRRFLQTGLLGSSALAAITSLPATAFAGPTKAARDPFDGLKLGMASYSWRKFSLDQAIAMTKQVGLNYINLKDVHLALKSSTAERQAAHQKITDAGLTLMGGGVIYMKNDATEVRGIFDYAKESGMPTIVCSPDPEALDTVEKMAKEYDLRVAIHNHGPTDKKYPSPLDVLKLVKDRDARMGICMDVGHTVRIGEDPVVVIKQCASRLYDFHIKDVTEAAANGGAIEVGKGVIDIVGVLKALVEIKFPGHVGLEYEANGDAPLPGANESVAYMRGVLAAIG